jgi:hypothetical protein
MISDLLPSSHEEPKEPSFVIVGVVHGVVMAYILIIVILWKRK